MRTSLSICVILATGLATGCSKSRPARTLPPPPEFTTPAALPVRPASAASEGRQTAIAPEDQVRFGFDSAVLEPSALAVLDDVARWVQVDPARTILVKGHSDHVGTARYNLELSNRRAAAVAAYLRGRGVAADRMVMVAVGEADAHVAPNEGNRRVVIYALATGPATAAQ